MSSVIEFVRSYEGLKSREKRYLDDAVRQAKERAREDRISVYRTLHQLVRVDKVPISKVCLESGLSRTSIYRWLEEYDEIVSYEVKSIVDDLAWTDVKVRPGGEVMAVDKEGNTWLLYADGEAWNKGTNKTLSSVSDWPDGARDAFDTATAASDN